LFPESSRQQQAKSWELRAATSLARLWQSQGKRQDAYDLLQPVSRKGLILRI
jgi:predicted ATPase